MNVPFCDLSVQHKKIHPQIISAINKVIKRSDFILGEDVPIFENEFAKVCSCRYAVGVSSGTEALFLALLSLNIGQGDEVVVPALTYIATALAVSYTGAKPVFVDIDSRTYNIDVSKVEQAITSRTKAIIPVHLYGQPADMPEILKIARKYKLKVIEDAAQAHGASIKIGQGKWPVTGGIGDIGCFSFYPTKNLGALGDGGIVTTNDADIYKKLLMLRDYGRVSRYEHILVGYNSRLDTVQAAVLRIKLKYLDRWNQMRGEIAVLYNRYLAGVEDVITPFVRPSVKPVYHIYVIMIPKRDSVLNYLKDRGIGVIIHYPIPLHLQKAYKDLGYKKGDFPVAEDVAGRIISLPTYPYLTKKQIKFVADNIKRALAV